MTFGSQALVKWSPPEGCFLSFSPVPHWHVPPLCPFALKKHKHSFAPLCTLSSVYLFIPPRYAQVHANAALQSRSAPIYLIHLAIAIFFPVISHVIPFWH